MPKISKRIIKPSEWGCSNQKNPQVCVFVFPLLPALSLLAVPIHTQCASCDSPIASPLTSTLSSPLPWNSGFLRDLLPNLDIKHLPVASCRNPSFYVHVSACLSFLHPLISPLGLSLELRRVQDDFILCPCFLGWGRVKIKVCVQDSILLSN